MLRDHALESRRDRLDRLVPLDLAAVQARLQQPSGKTYGLAECRALGTQCTAIRRMLRITADLGRAIKLHTREDATTHPAIGAGRAHDGTHDTGAPNSNCSRSALMSQPSLIRSEYQPPSRVSPYSTAPRTRLFSSTRRL